LSDEPDRISTDEAIKNANDFAEAQRQKEEELRIRTEKLQNQIKVIETVVSPMITPIVDDLKDQRQQIESIKVALNQIINILQPQPAQQTATQAAPNDAMATLNQLPPEMKVQALNGLLDGVSRLIAAWKSGSAPQIPASNNWFNEFSQQIIANMLQAGVDGMMQNVYRNYNPTPPPPITNTLPRPAPPQTPHTLE
jgi:hypothetical protein